MGNAIIGFNIFGKEILLNPARYFTVFGFKIHWYGVIIAIGMLIAIIYAMRRSRYFGLTEDNIIDMILIVVPLGIVGARILYVMFNFDKFKGDILGMFKIWEGGLAIYGGIVLAIAGVYIYCRMKKMPLAPFLDIAGLALLIAQSIGRWGNFINREVYGVPTDLPWAMYFTQNGQTISAHPLFLYESLWNALGFVILHFYSKKRKYDGQVFAMYAFWYGLARYFFEQLRSDTVLYLFNTDIRVSQLIGLISMLLAFVYMMKHAVRKPKPMYAEIVTSDTAKEKGSEDNEMPDDKAVCENKRADGYNIEDGGYIEPENKENDNDNDKEE